MTTETVELLTEEELEAVAAYLEETGVWLAGPLSAERISGGRSNLTFCLDDGVRRFVMRMPPRTGRTPSAHDVAREHRVTSALMGSGVPVATTVALCEDESLIGSPFAVSAFVPGTAVQTRTELDHMDDDTLQAVVSRLVEVLARLHRLDHEHVGLVGFGRPDGYVDRQIRRWTSQWEIVAPDGSAHRRTAAEAIARLTAQAPAQRAVGIVHGDFRIDNTLLVLDGPTAPCVAAVVDWELATLGDPVADVAMMCAYRDRAFDQIVGVRSAWTSSRLPKVDTLAQAYEAAGGVPLADWDFHLALAYFKIAVIAAGIDHRYRVGAGRGPGFDSAGASVAPYLEASLGALRATT